MSAPKPGDITESQRLGLTAHVRSEDEGFEVYNLAHGHLFRTIERFRCVIFADGWNEAVDRLVDDPAAVGGVATELEALSQRILDEIPRRSGGVADGLRLVDGWASDRAAALRATVATTDGDAEMSAAERATEMAKAGAAGHVSGLSLGDVVTVEPPLGVVLSDEDNGLWKHLPHGWAHYRADGRRHERLSGLGWDTVYCARPLRVVELPGDEVAPAEARWSGPACEDTVWVPGDITRDGNGDLYWRSWDNKVWIFLLRFPGEWKVTPDLGPPITPLTLVARKGQPVCSRHSMPEPGPGAVVRHAGGLWARHANNLMTGNQFRRWRIFAGPNPDPGSLWVDWPELLALDPSIPPVLVDLVYAEARAATRV